MDEMDGSGQLRCGVKERPIIFNSEMVRAILAGRKTQMRRPVKYGALLGHPHDWCHMIGDEKAMLAHFVGDYTRFCPLGQIGDRMWVRETFFHSPDFHTWYKADCKNTVHKWVPSIHMPRRASRITLEITGIRVERVQDITNGDAMKEGLLDATQYNDCYVCAFKRLWDSIYSNWDQNPWVWVVEFKVIEKGGGK